MGSIFNTKPVITKNEVEIAKNRLVNEHGFNPKKTALFEEMVKPYVEDAEQYGDPVGVSPQEVKEIDQELEAGDPKHVFSQHFSEPEIEAIEKVLNDALITRK